LTCGWWTPVGFDAADAVPVDSTAADGGYPGQSSFGDVGQLALSKAFIGRLLVGLNRVVGLNRADQLGHAQASCLVVGRSCRAASRLRW
jgi:hypothetical protein